MIDEAVQLFSAFAKDVDNGFVEMASTLPRTRLGGGTLPALSTFAIFDDVNDDSVAKDLDPPKVPAVILWGDSTADAPANKLYRICKNVIIAVAYVTDVGADAKKANSDCNYALRGATISLARYNSLRMMRELNGIKVHEVTSIEEERVTAAVGTRKMWGFLRVRAIVGETFQ